MAANILVLVPGLFFVVVAAARLGRGRYSIRRAGYGQRSGNNRHHSEAEPGSVFEKTHLFNIPLLLRNQHQLQRTSLTLPTVCQSVIMPGS
jgi:hypothetical protein